MGLFRKTEKAKEHLQTSPLQPKWNPTPHPIDSSRNRGSEDWRDTAIYGHGSPTQDSWATPPSGPPPQYQPQPPDSAPNMVPPPQTLRNQRSKVLIKKMASVSNLLNGDVPSHVPGAAIFNDSHLTHSGSQCLDQGETLYDVITSKLNAVVTSIDQERFSGDERELAVFEPPQPIWEQEQVSEATREAPQKSKALVNNPISSALASRNYFAKVSLYANSRLPPDLPRMKLYIPTFPILCLAAEYSERAYANPTGREKETQVFLDADWRNRRKAMVIKSVPMDDMNLVVLAIRGSDSFMDWAVNFDTHPVSPEGFLDDPGNLCHAGFLSVARSMIKPVAARLQQLADQNPSQSKYSLLITGHSAGGAVAALLYSHMHSTSNEAASELRNMNDRFKRVHCVTFGAPPMSLLPLVRSDDPIHKKSLFFSFLNEGDPVARADKAYVRSLLDLYAHPAPGHSCLITPASLQPLLASAKSNGALAVQKLRPGAKHAKSAPTLLTAPYWPVPEATLSNAGRLVLLRGVERHEMRGGRKERRDEGVVAQMISDELLRGVVWGDPVCHMMRLYARRIEVLATNAVMGRS